MKQQINEIRRMQQLAGLINENEIMDDEDIKIGTKVLDGMNDIYKLHIID